MKYDKYQLESDKKLLLFELKKQLEKLIKLPHATTTFSSHKDFKKGIDLIVAFRDGMPEAYKKQVAVYINNMILKGIAESKEQSGETELANYVKQQIK